MWCKKTHLLVKDEKENYLDAFITLPESFHPLMMIGIHVMERCIRMNKLNILK